MGVNVHLLQAASPIRIYYLLHSQVLTTHRHRHILSPDYTIPIG